MLARITALSLLLAGFAAQALEAPATRAEGIVFVDVNGSGVRDAGEPPFPGAKLSNGRDIVLSDGEGRYALRLQPGDTLFLIKPAGHAVARRADGLPDTWQHHSPAPPPHPVRYGGIAPVRAIGGDFALRPVPDAGPLDVLVFGDPQPKRAQDVEYFRRDIVEPLAANPGAKLGLTLGDIVDDDLSLHPAVIAATTALGLPWLHAPGNHDIDFDVARDEESLQSWRASFGADTYAWEETQASFIVLDDVIYQPNASPSYVGGLREDQFRFLERYLATLPKARRLVIAAHIPFQPSASAREAVRVADRERLFALLAPFHNVLLLTSHAHAQRHYFHGAADGWHGAAPLHEYIVGAACGGYWSGLPDAQGIPDARMSDGTPNGYARLHIDGENYTLRWFAARDPADTRIALHAPKVLRRGAYPAFAVTANVFMGMDDTRVEYRIDEGEWKPMTRSQRVDPALLALNVADDASETLRSYDRFVEAGESTHLWRGTLPTHLTAGEHHVDVRAFDRWEGELHASTSYRLDEFVAPAQPPAAGSNPPAARPPASSPAGKSAAR